MVRFVANLFRFVKDLVAYCWIHEVWWPLPVVGLLVIIGTLVLTTQTVVPYIYTLF